MSPSTFRAAFLAVTGFVVGCDSEPLEVAPEVELTRFQGTWHEVAHLPRPMQKACRGTTATYTAEADGKLRLEHQCTLPDGRYSGSTAIATVRDRAVPAKMAVDFGGFVGDYWVLEVAPDYRYAVVGHPSRDYLWILSRAPVMAPQDLEVVLAHAKANNFDTTRLEYTPAGPEAQGTPAPPVEYGCSVRAATPAGSSTGAPTCLFLGMAALASWARRRRAPT